MSADVPAIIRWDQAYNRNGDATLPRAVMNTLRTYMNNTTLEGWVKGETLAGATGLKIRGVRRQLAANIKAGWLEIVQSGNSSGLANSYRLTYPKGVLQDTLDRQRVSYRTEKGVLQDTPTTPRTSPKRSSIGTTPVEKGEPQFTLDPRRVNHSTEKGEPQFTLADPGGSRIMKPVNAKASAVTTESKGEPQFTLAGDADYDAMIEAAAAEHFAAESEESTEPGWGNLDEASSSVLKDSGDPLDPFSFAYIPPAKRG